MTMRSPFIVIDESTPLTARFVVYMDEIVRMEMAAFPARVHAERYAAKANTEHRREPGTRSAEAAGCTCPVLDNGGGLGVGGRYVINGECPLHGGK